MLPVTTVIINYRTADLTRRAIESFRGFYPAKQLLLIDNGSRDESVEVLENSRHRFPQFTEVLLNTTNLHHGPAMDQGIHQLQTRYVFFVDSDCEISRGGFLELMIDELEHRQMGYAIGHRVWMNRRGFDIENNRNAIPYIRPYFMLIQRELYLRLPPFEKHGTPCLKNMKTAKEHGFALINFSVGDYVNHRGRGTAHQHGYNLGVRGRWNYFMNRLGL